MTEAARRDNGATLLAEEEGEEETPGGANIEWGGIFVKEVLRGLWRVGNTRKIATKEWEEGGVQGTEEGG